MSRSSSIDALDLRAETLSAASGYNTTVSESDIAYEEENRFCGLRYICLAPYEEAVKKLNDYGLKIFE